MIGHHGREAQLIGFDDDPTVDAVGGPPAPVHTEPPPPGLAPGREPRPIDPAGIPEDAGRGRQDVNERLESIRAGEFGESPAIVEGYGALREIGRGGFSRVYEALEFEFRRWVAIKVLNERLSGDEETAEFERECRLMGVLSRHPNIVTVFASAFTSDHRPCIVMELFPHGSYFNILQRFGPLGVEELLALAVRVSGALATTHHQGIVHGDVKPQNVFRSEFGSPSLGDFGIATLMHRRMASTRTRLSLHYAAPELIEHGISATSPFADQYSLAATIYTLATGLRPFADQPGADTGELLLRVSRDPAPRLGPGFPKSFDDALGQAMAREPEDRHRDVAAFAATVSRVEQELGLKPTELPVSRDGGRYMGPTPESEDPLPGTASRSQDAPAAVAPGTGDRPPVAAGRDEPAGAVSMTVVRPMKPLDSGSSAPELEQLEGTSRVPLRSMIGWFAAGIAAAAAIVAVFVIARTGEDPAEAAPVAAAASGGVAGEGADPEDGAAAAPAGDGAPEDKDGSVAGTGEPAAPAAPGNLVVQAHDRGLVVTWDEPHDGGSAITEYRLEVFVDGTKKLQLRRPGDERRAEFTGLVNGAIHEVRLVAVNEAGASEPAWGSAVPNPVPSGSPE